MLWPSVLMLSPLAGILVLALLPKTQHRALRWTGFAATLLPLAVALGMASRFDAEAQAMQFAGSAPWFTIPLPGMMGGDGFVFRYTVGVDGLSMALILLTVILCSVVALGAIHLTERVKGFLLLLLLLETALLGTFVSLNLLQFFLFFELVIVAMYFLISQFGFVERERAGLVFLLYNGIGSLVLLLALLTMMAVTGTLDWHELQEQLHRWAAGGDFAAMTGLSESFRWGLLLAVLAAFVIKLPVVPLHSWMIRVNRQAHPLVVMLESGLVLKLGGYGMLRLGFGLFPDLMMQLGTVLAVLGLVNLFYGGFAALVQQDLRSVLAYASVSHMGIVLLGMAAMNASGLQGVIFQMVSHGLLSPLLFYILLVILVRTGTDRLSDLSGLIRVMPVLSGLFLAGAMGYLGLPLMSGFVSEFLAFHGLFQRLPGFAAVGVLGMVLTAAYMLRAMQGMTFGPTVPQLETGDMRDVRAAESVPAMTLLALVFVIGIVPSLLGDPLQSTLQTILLRLGG
ncbi:MAG: NADH-quinone oxidoreductase subunit M [Bacillota bacterium]|nr:NADH-quinone oxidoreductase subunit M [Bacillota bacterium]